MNKPGCRSVLAAPHPGFSDQCCTTWIENAVDTKLANGAVTVTSYPPNVLASIMVFQTWAGAEDAAALATSSSVLSVDHAFYMQPSTLSGNGSMPTTCVFRTSRIAGVISG